MYCVSFKYTNFSDESRIAHQRKVTTDNMKTTPRRIKFPKKIFQPAAFEKMGEALYIIPERYRVKMPQLMNKNRRRETVDHSLILNSIFLQLF